VRLQGASIDDKALGPNASKIPPVALFTAGVPAGVRLAFLWAMSGSVGGGAWCDGDMAHLRFFDPFAV
jgi:hypothetical protein